MSWARRKDGTHGEAKWKEIFFFLVRVFFSFLISVSVEKRWDWGILEFRYTYKSYLDRRDFIMSTKVQIVPCCECFGSLCGQALAKGFGKGFRKGEGKGSRLIAITPYFSTYLLKHQFSASSSSEFWGIAVGRLHSTSYISSLTRCIAEESMTFQLFSSQGPGLALLELSLRR